jgi:hypothetical protein
MNRKLILLAMVMPLLAHAEPASQIAWKPEVLNRIKHGNINKGKELAK